MAYFITGAAGFIGSTLVDRLLGEGYEVIGYDNFSTGERNFLAGALQSKSFTLIEGDLLDSDGLKKAMSRRPIELVCHMAANADIRKGTADPHRDLEQNTIATFKVLEAMRDTGSKKIAYASSSAIYGDAAVIPTPENVAMPIQISLYGASKSACEGLISAYCECFDFQTWVFRFVSVLGERYTHGHIFDFVKQLRRDASKLVILGDGHQRKSYMHVRDCVDAILIAVQKSNGKINIFNLGLDEYVEVNQSAAWIARRMGLSPKFEYTGGSRGWVGDSPFVWLSPARIFALGWKPKVSIEQAVIRTVDWLQANAWALTRD